MTEKGFWDKIGGTAVTTAVIAVVTTVITSMVTIQVINANISHQIDQIAKIEDRVTYMEKNRYTDRDALKDNEVVLTILKSLQSELDLLRKDVERVERGLK